jgi:hypothetical protein
VSRRPLDIAEQEGQGAGRKIAAAFHVVRVSHPSRATAAVSTIEVVGLGAPHPIDLGPGYGIPSGLL